MKNQFEWVMTISKGDEIVLTENQYEFYKENFKESKVFFKDFEINPAFVISAYKRPAETIKKLYPCKNCFTCGQMKDYSVCPVCEGSGVCLP